MQKNVTIADIARETGVSTATVSYILNGKKSISSKTKEKVFAAIEKLDYVPSINARSLSTRDSFHIGVFIPQTEPGGSLMFENMFYGEILSAIEYEARTQGYHIFISGRGVDESCFYLARRRNLDGIIAIGVYQDEGFLSIEDSGVPLVLVDSYCNESPHNAVRIDDHYGGYLAARFLLDRGHRNIAFFSGRQRDNGVMQKRFEGYRQALAEQGAPFRQEFVFSQNVDFDDGVMLARKLIGTHIPVSAVSAAADVLAIGAAKAFSDAGLRIPQDISIIGFDDLRITQYITPGLTTVRQEIALKGKKAVEMLIENIRQPASQKRTEILPLTVVERESVRTLEGSNQEGL
ncbi:MAG: LacI family transcriptional regulator [Treponema sp.]|jgi:LacI family transcriptional regulator|nr:LacI family transcriptional regulator [Treponema sp.]